MDKLKKSFSKILIIMLLFNLFITYSSADFINIYEERESQKLSRGVVHEKILRFTDQGWLNLNVITIDLDDKYTSLDVLTNPEGISKRDSLSKLVNSNEGRENIVGAINGDFFDIKEFATMGPVVKDGELITSSFKDPSFAAFSLDNDSIPALMSWVENNMTLQNGENGYLLNINYKNKPYINNKVVLLDKNWGEFSFGNEKYQDIVEMVVIDNRVDDIRLNQEAIEIPEDGYIISATGSAKDFILNNFLIDHEVLLNINTTPDFENLKLAMGGGSIILKDGVALDNYTLKIPGRHPRSAIGISRDKKKIFLLTVDGRTSYYTGATQKELANILLELGAHDGINLDGGGSTEMTVRNLGNPEISIANRPSGGYERKILNGLAVLNNSPEASLKDITINTEDQNVFVETSRSFEIKAYDQYYKPLEIDLDDVAWSVEGIDGSFKDNIFTPSTSGKGTITAYYDGKSASIDIKAIDNPIRLEVSPSKIFLDTDSEVSISAYGVNGEGYRAKVNPDDLMWSIPGDIGEIEDNKFITSDNPDNGIITASLRDIKAYIQVAIGYNEDILEDFEGKNGSFLSYPQEVTGNYELSSNSKTGNSSGKLSYDFTGTDATRAAYIVFNDEGIAMEDKPIKLGLWVYGKKGNAHWLRGKLKDSAGNYFTLDFSKNIDWDDWKHVEAHIPASAVAPLKLERIYLVETDPYLKDTGSIYIDDLTAFYKSDFSRDIPEDNTVYIDMRNTPMELEGENSFRFLAHGSIPAPKTLLDRLVINHIAELSNGNETSVFANTVDKSLADKLNNKYLISDSGYSATKFKNATFIELDNNNGGIRSTDYTQWPWFLNQMNSLNTDSLFILLPKGLDFNDKLEEKLFMDTINELKEEKNTDIWILLGGNNDRFKIEAKNGIRIVKLKTYPTKENIDIFNDLKYMIFTVNDGYVTYEIKNMYENN